MPDNFVDAVSTYAQDIDNLILLIAVLVGFWFLLAEAVFFAFLWKFRARDGQKAEYITGEDKKQKRWVTIPHLLVLVCDVFILYGAIQVWVDVKQTLPVPDREIRVIGQQWAWTFVTPGPDGKLDTEDDIRTVDELHIEEGLNYHFKLTAVDVVHSFSVPAFRLKQDAIPGREIVGWFNAGNTGTYDIQCAEMCGIGHGIMGAKLFIEDKATHATWIDAASGTSFAAVDAAGEAPTTDSTDARGGL